MTTASFPPFMLTAPQAPKVRQRLYNGRRLIVWEGQIKVADIKGWVDNPRILLAKRTMQDRIGPRELTQDEIFEIMKTDPEVKLKALRDDILKNGLREPLTLSFDGRLLDGNRRFFAVKFALEALPQSDPNRRDLETIEVHVLAEDASEADLHNVLVEENFSASLKLEWPEYVKAESIAKANSDGYGIDEIAKVFNWTKAKIKETLKIIDLIEEFKAFATEQADPADEAGGGLGMSELEAEMLAAKNYQFFNEAQKSFLEPLKTNFEFKLQFFRWVAEGKFSSFQEVRIAWRAWGHPEARAAIFQPEPTAAKSAKAILEYDSRVVRSAEESTGRIDNFLKFMRGMTMEQLGMIPPQTLTALEEILALVRRARIKSDSEEPNAG